MVFSNWTHLSLIDVFILHRIEIEEGPLDGKAKEAEYIKDNHIECAIFQSLCSFYGITGS